VTAPSQPRVGAPPKAKSSSTGKTNEEDGDDEVLSEISEELDYGDEDEEKDGEDDDEKEEAKNIGGSNDEDAMSVTMETADAAEVANDNTQEGKTKRERKRKRKHDNDDLEGKYLAKLVGDDEPEPSGKRLKGDGENTQEEASEDDDDENEAPVHESLTQESKQTEMEKATRTVFLGNVATEAISSKSAKKELMKHLASVLDKDASPPQKIESLRFRSVAFSSGAMPKRAAYITKSLMDATTKSTNAYAVFSDPAAARKVVTELNGSEVLGRHIRVDSVAHPSPMNHRCCVFVGNLGFVDDETVLNTKAGGETVEKKRNKVPSDIEEGLWRTFGTKGKVQNVRVVRDPKTRVGKGFAYVQFYVSSPLGRDGKIPLSCVSAF
jgi:nucleolar protein 12